MFKKIEENELPCVSHPASTVVSVWPLLFHLYLFPLSHPRPHPPGIILKQIPGILSFHQQIFCSIFYKRRLFYRKNIITISLTFLKILTKALYYHQIFKQYSNFPNSLSSPTPRLSLFPYKLFDSESKQSQCLQVFDTFLIFF